MSLNVMKMLSNITATRISRRERERERERYCMFKGSFLSKLQSFRGER